MKMTRQKRVIAYAFGLLLFASFFSFPQGIPSPKHKNFNLHLEEELTLTGSEDNPDGMLTGITMFGLDSNENFYVLDRKHPGVLKFNSKGQFLKKIGQKGQGPSDIMSPYSLAVSEKHHFFVYDGGNSRISKFTHAGEFIDSIKILGNFWGNFFPYKEQNVFAFTLNITETHSSQALHKFDRSGKPIDKIISFFKKKHNMKGGGVMGGIIFEYSPKVYLCPVDEKRFAFGNNLEDKINIYNAETSTQKSFKLNIITPQKITADELDYYKRRYKTTFKMLQFPPHRPFFSRILCDERGRLYVVRFNPAGKKDDGYIIDIFNLKGEYLYNTRSQYEPWIIKNGKLYTVDNRDEVAITKYSIKNYDKLQY